MARLTQRVLVTGADGFVGRHAIAAFALNRTPGDQLAGIGLTLPPGAPEDVALFATNILDATALTQIVSGFAPTHVLHLEELSSFTDSSAERLAIWRTNYIGVLCLAEAMSVGAPGATLVFASSGEVYGRTFLAGTPLPETAVPEPANAYARTKLAGEGILTELIPAAGIRLIVARPFNHIGPGQDERFVVASFAAQIARIEAGLSPPVLEVGDLTARRDFLDVADIVAAYRSLIDASSNLPDVGVFNIASGVARPIAELLEGLRAAARVPFAVEVAPGLLRPAQIPTASGDASALAHATGWQPRVALCNALVSQLNDARHHLR